MKKMNKKGFTLAELLIVVAIIAVLVAIAIPVFSTQLEKSRDAVCMSNIRSAYAEAQAAYLTGTGDGTHVVVTWTNGKISSIAVDKVAIKSQKDDNWSGLCGELPFLGGTNQMTVAAFEALDAGANADKTITFTYGTGTDNLGEITAVAFS